MSVLVIILLIIYLIGLFFNVAAVVGILRLPDVYCRLHSSSKNTTLGSLLIILALVIRQLEVGAYPAAVKILFMGLLLLIVTPIGSHALARAAYKFGVPLWEGTIVDQYAQTEAKGSASGD
jgi:multicomponent Na+:H+ antiporter subunit G